MSTARSPRDTNGSMGGKDVSEKLPSIYEVFLKSSLNQTPLNRSVLSPNSAFGKTASKLGKQSPKDLAKLDKDVAFLEAKNSFMQTSSLWVRGSHEQVSKSVLAGPRFPNVGLQNFR